MIVNIGAMACESKLMIETNIGASTKRSETSSSTVNSGGNSFNLWRDKFWNRWSTRISDPSAGCVKWMIIPPTVMENQPSSLKDPNTKPLTLAYGAYFEYFR
ncbi:hypothetical protein TNCV_4682701 [Trichonephila clavipes]|nr:hypothetical protein TNCV_4682701 [Trichonephila clavipes]